jgi:hypothetical protein
MPCHHPGRVKVTPQLNNPCQKKLTSEVIYRDRSSSYSELNLSIKGGATGKAGPSDLLSPILADHHNILTSSVIEGSMRVGQGWSTSSASPLIVATDFFESSTCLHVEYELIIRHKRNYMSDNDFHRIFMSDFISLYDINRQLCRK